MSLSPGDALLIELDDVSRKLLSTLVHAYQDPKQACLWSGEGRGLDAVHLGIFSGFLPPEALEQPRKYRLVTQVIVERLHHLKTLDLVAPKQDQPLHEGAQPTEAAIEHVASLRRPWWRALLDRLGAG